MQPELLEHFALGNHNYFLNGCSIILIDKRDGSDPMRKEEYWEKDFEDCSSLWVKYFRLMVVPIYYTHFPEVENLVNIKCKLLFKSYSCIL